MDFEHFVQKKKLLIEKEDEEGKYIRMEQKTLNIIFYVTFKAYISSVYFHSHNIWIWSELEMQCLYSDNGWAEW